MESNYSFLNNVLDGKPKTVWSYTKQKKFLNIVLNKYPEPIDLKNKLLRIGTDNSKLLANYIDENWDREAYIDFILKYIVKYSRTGKILVSQLIGTAIGSLIGYGINNYLNSQNQALTHTKDEVINGYNELEKAGATEAQKNSYLNSILDDQKRLELNKASTIRNISPFVTGIGTKGLAAYGSYKLLDAIDKKTSKKNA